MLQTLKAILADCLQVNEDIPINGLCLDSRKIQPGNLFVALQGAKNDGVAFIDDAIKRGAAAVIADKKIMPAKNIPIIYLPNLAKLLGKIAANFYDHPARQLKIAGITGTNGKTSCAYFIAQALEKLNVATGLIGTLGIGMLNNLVAQGLTTPDAITLQKALHDFLNNHVGHVAMEVSSHSLVQSRVAEIFFEVGVFTNLTLDHLDYHGTMQAYGLAKQQLFENDRCRHAVLNADDAFSRIIQQNLHRRFLTYSLWQPSADIFAEDIRYDHGIKALVHTPWGRATLSVNLVGDFNLSNVLATLASLCLFGIPLNDAVQALSKINCVPGRMEKVGGDHLPDIIIDFSHTPDALEKALKTLKKQCQGKLICVFGCGGDRDKGKRPIMGKIAEQYADMLIITNDNPRTEDPLSIANDILAGMLNPQSAKVTLDRADAIELSLSLAASQDCILIAGKGAECFQYIGEEKIVFNDKDKVKRFIGEP